MHHQGIGLVSLVFQINISLEVLANFNLKTFFADTIERKPYFVQYERLSGRGGGAEGGIGTGTGI